MRAADRLSADLSLQWGRSGEGAEDGDRPDPLVGRCSGFNGAAPVRERKRGPMPGRPSSPAGLQWGRSGEGAEDSRPPGPLRCNRLRGVPREVVPGGWLDRVRYGGPATESLSARPGSDSREAAVGRIHSYRRIVKEFARDPSEPPFHHPAARGGSHDKPSYPGAPSRRKEPARIGRRDPAEPPRVRPGRPIPSPTGSTGGTRRLPGRRPRRRASRGRPRRGWGGTGSPRPGHRSRPAGAAR